MKLLLPNLTSKTSLFILSLFLFSCARYQYMTIASDGIGLNSNLDLEAEEDSMRVTYRFSGSNAPVQVTIFNKSSKSLLVDWTRSSLVIREEAFTFHDPTINIEGEVIRSGANRLNASIDAKALVKEGAAFIPPQSSVGRSGPQLFDGHFLNIDNNNQGGSLEAQRDSSFQFRIFLTVFPGANTHENPLVLDKTFYISELHESGKRPKARFGKTSPGNVGYMGKRTKSAVGYGLLAGIAALVVVNAIAEQ